MYIKPITIDGQTFDSIKEAIAHFGIGTTSLYKRLKKGMALEDALTIKPRASTKTIKINGEMYSTISEACDAYSVKLSTFSNRRLRGWTTKEALGIKPRKNIPSDKCTGRVYLITNNENNKQYIGITTKKIKIRLQQHFSSARNGSTTKLHQAIATYGESAFSIKRIAKTRSRKELEMLEKQWITHYDSIDTGYNTYSGGNLSIGSRGKPIKYKGKMFQSHRALAAHLGVQANTVSQRLARLEMGKF